MGLRLAGRCPGAAIGIVGNRIGNLFPDRIECHVTTWGVAGPGIVGCAGTIGFGVPVLERPAGAGRGRQRYGCRCGTAVPLGVQRYGCFGCVAGSSSVTRAGSANHRIPVLKGITGHPSCRQFVGIHRSAVCVQRHSITARRGVCSCGFGARQCQRFAMGFRLTGRCPGAAIGVVGNRISDPLPNGIERRVRAGGKQLSRLISRRCSGRSSSPAQECIPAADRYGA